MKLKRSKKIFISLSTLGAVALIAFGITANIICKNLDATLTAALGDLGKGHTNIHYDGVDQNYYNSKFDSKDEVLNFQKETSYNIVKEGITLLEKGNIPYEKDTKVSLFSQSSVNFIFGGTGSGVASSDLSLKNVFEENGFDVNDGLWDFYKNGKGKNFHRGIGSINYGDFDDYSINECPLSLITSESKVTNSFKEYDTAIFVLSRTGGEGNDLARGMNDYVDTSKDLSKGYHKDSTGDKYKSYLEPDSIELEIIDYLNKNFKDVILLVNCNNPMELGWVKEYEKIKTVVSVPGTGNYGLEALPQILNGDVVASGHLTDTYVYNSFSSPAMMNMGDFQYLDENGNKIANYEGQSWADGYYYVVYSEGIYVGYRYYETRYEDQILNKGSARAMAEHEVNGSKEVGSDTWDYSKEVIYPFGYGDSTSEFSWSEYNVTQEGDDFIATIKVTNIGDVAGKEVVQLYAQTPYGEREKENNVEKSSVELIGYQKTKELKPNESEVITISFNKEDLTSYDYNNLKGYYLSEGQYYFTAAKDAHAAVNNILRAKAISSDMLIASPSEEVAGNIELVDTSFYVKEYDFKSFVYDSTTGFLVNNKFNIADINPHDKNHVYLSRKNWEETYPKTYGEVSNRKSIHSERINGKDASGNPVGYEYFKTIDINSSLCELMRSYDALNPLKPEDITEKITRNNLEADLELIDLRGRDYYDPLWNILISRLSVEEASKLIQNGGYKTEGIPTINKPETSDKDGPAGLNSVAGHFPLGPAYPCGLLIAQTWNRELAYNKGEAIAEDCYINQVSGWYGPGNNIHRTPFGGRNFEYYSEDPFVSSEVAKNETIAVAEQGIFVYIKHFALNNQEIHREKESGLCTYSNEQAIREIYLKAFEDVIKGNKIEETYYEVDINEKGQLIKDSNGNYKFTKKTREIEACLGIMSSFNRIGPVWAGGNYQLITRLLREERGFKGAVLTDYYHTWFMDTKQAIMAGGSISLDPSEEKFIIDTNDKVFTYQAREAVKSILYTVANSYAMNGYIHGVKETNGLAVYEVILIAVDIVVALGAISLLFLSYRIYKKAKKEGNNIAI